ncbi:MAG: hypothetical protein IJ335_10895 [Lachnospiraceae bacterium]|nr:hypothetical protein [Lachnospiraceae bacterium]
MRIDSSAIGMESARSYKASGTTFTRFVIRDYQTDQRQAGTTLGNNAGENTAELSGENQENVQSKTGSSTPVQKDWQSYFGISSGKLNLRREDESIAENLRQVTLRYIFQMLFADRRNRLEEWMEEKGLVEDVTSRTAANGSGQSDNRMNPLAVSEQMLSFQQVNHYYEQETTTFSSRGTVVTGDGRTIDFGVKVGMSREFEQTFIGQMDLAAVQLMDPLVINLDTDVAKVTDQHFFFDLDSDGSEEELSMLGNGSGYLALDKNGDGSINDGSELFGTKSGDGFRELAAYDEDGDGWIDEDDSIWSKLQIWCKDENGRDHLYRLADKGVGAICLSNSATEFAQKDVEGALDAVIRSTGVFLFENGQVGTVQQLDLARH